MLPRRSCLVIVAFLYVLQLTPVKGVAQVTVKIARFGGGGVLQAERRTYRANIDFLHVCAGHAQYCPRIIITSVSHNATSRNDDAPRVKFRSIARL